MRIDRHIFGSIRGYQTLARTDGITDADVRVLEGLSVGAPASSSVLAALAACPAYVVLPLGGRRAVTRISEGNPDDQGRPTIQQVTLVVSKAHWDTVLKGDVLSLIRREDLWKWDGQPSIQAMDLPSRGSAGSVASPESADKILAMLSLLERGMTGGKTVLVREQDFTLEEFGLLERLLPPAARAGQTLIYRAFGVSARASLVCIAREAALAPADGMYRPGQPVDPSPYALAVAQAGFKLGHIPDGFVRSYRGFGMTPRTHPSVPSPGKTTPADLPPQVIVERTPRWLLLTTASVCLLFAVVAGVSLWMYRGAKQGYDRSVTQLQLIYRELEGAKKDKQDTAKELIDARTRSKEASDALAAASRERESRDKDTELLKSINADQNQRIASLQNAMNELLQEVSLPVFSKVQRSNILKRCSDAAQLLKDSPVAQAAIERVGSLDKRAKAMDAFEAGAESPPGRLTTYPASDPEVDRYYVGICNAAKRCAASIEETLPVGRSAVRTAGSGNAGAPVARGPAQQTGDRTGLASPAASNPPVRQSTEAVTLSAPPAQKYVEAIKEVSDQLEQLRVTLGSIRAGMERAREGIEKADDPKSKLTPDQRRDFATKKLEEVVKFLDQWQVVLRETRQKAVSLSWVQEQIEMLRGGLPRERGLEVGGGPSR